MSVPDREILDFVATLPGLDTLQTPIAHFFYYDPARDTPHDKRQPFTTLVTADDYDPVSDLSRPGVYRLNIGVTRETYQALLGPLPPWGKDGGPIETGHDFTRLDTILPHPIYAPLGWICILNPSHAQWPRVQDHIREAHALAARQYATRRAARS